MLSKGDDYPIHQTPEPVAFAGTDRNFYDRYFFNGYSGDGDLFFAAALGVYPALNIMDAAFGLRIGGIQYNIRASRHLGMERMDTQVGPIRVEVIEPLQTLRIVVDDKDHGIAADILFEGRMAPVQEARVTRRHGPRTIMDFTRMTQFGRYSGWVRAGGRDIAFGEDVTGVRDRSWGVRAVGERDPQAMVPAQVPQFHWFWLPAFAGDRGILFFLNEDADGSAWHKGMIVCHTDGCVEHLAAATIDVTFAPGTRWPTQGIVTAPTPAGDYRVAFTPGPKFFMTGIGYINPEWAHGVNKGPLAIGYDEIRLDTVTEYVPPYLYAQAVSRVTITTPDGRTLAGMGTFEALSMGPHAHHGFTGFCDGA